MTSELSSADAEGQLRAVIGRIRRLFHQLAGVADELHGDLGITAAQRAVLETLVEDGPAAVPAMARAKGVSRQHIQMIVNDLLAAGLVELADNPAHQRSQLVRLTDAGSRVFEIMRGRERKVLRAMAAQLPARDLARAGRTLQEMSTYLEARAVRS